jgi:WD40 repeat protein
MTTVATHDLFISYAEADRAWVEGYLLDALDGAGVRYYSEAAFDLGVPRVEAFERAVMQSRRTLLVISPAYLADGFARFTNSLAYSYGVTSDTWPVIPLLLDRSIALPSHLAMLKRLDAGDPEHWPAVIARLCAELRRPVPATAPPPECPYPGMVPFVSNDARRFFGRDDEIQHMLQHLRRQPLLFIIGPSGSGKSSLISAGLIPSLVKGRMFPPNYWRVRTLRPSSPVLQSAGLATPADLERAIDRLLAEAPRAQRLLLVIDQFEELFALVDRAEQSRFIKALKAVRIVKRCTILIAMRADFYNDLMNSDLWPIDPSQRLELAPLRGDALRRAIEQPAEDRRVYLEAGLLERLLADAADEPGVLPLIQETMVLLWSKMARRLIPLSAYTQLSSGGRSGLAVAIASEADATLAGLSPEQQMIARRILLRLVQFGEGRADTRRQQSAAALRSVGDDAALFTQTLHHLANNRLLTLSGATKDDNSTNNHTRSSTVYSSSSVLVDIAHEALIGGWPTLRAWLTERREAEQIRRRLEDHAAAWVRMGSERGGLLDEVELLESERWLQSPEAADLGYGAALPELVRSSRAAIEEAQRLQEAARQRELAQALALAAEHEQRIAEQSRAATQLRWLVAILVFVALSAIGAAWYALTQARIASSRQLALQATSMLDDQLDLSLLLGLEAYRASVTHEARNSLIAARAHSPYLTTFLRQHAHEIESLAFSPDGKLFASGSCASLDDNQLCLQGEIRLWDANERRPIEPVLQGHAGSTTSLAFSPDGKLLASGGCAELSAQRCRRGEIQLWDVANRRPIGPPLTGHTDGVTSLAFSPDGKLLASGSWDKTIRLWDVADRRQQGTQLAEHTGTVSSVAFSPDGKLLASGSWDKTIRFWDVATHRLSGAPLVGHTNIVRSVAFSPDGKTFASGSVDTTIILWDVTTHQPRRDALKEHSGAVISVAWSPDSKLLASGSLDQQIFLWDAATGRRVGPKLAGHTDAVTSVAFSPNGKTLASGGEDTNIILWDLGPQLPLLGHTGSVESVAFSPSNNLLASAASDGKLLLWNIASHQPIDPPLSSGGKPLKSVAFSPNGKLLASGGNDVAVRLWDVASRQPIDLPLTGHTRSVVSVAFSPDSQLLASGSVDGTIILWDATSRQAIAELDAGGTAVESVAFSPNGKLLASGGHSGKVILWDIANRQALGQLISSTNNVYSVAFSPDGALLATGGADQNIVLWNVATREQAGKLTGHTKSVYSLAFSPDGAVLASGSGDRTVILWDVRSQQRLGEPLLGHTDSVFSVMFSADGRRLSTGSQDGTVIPWDVGFLQARDFASWQADICATVTRNMTNTEWRQYGNDLLLDRTICP